MRFKPDDSSPVAGQYSSQAHIMLVSLRCLSFTAKTTLAFVLIALVASRLSFAAVENFNIVPDDRLTTRSTRLRATLEYGLKRPMKAVPLLGQRVIIYFLAWLALKGVIIKVVLEPGITTLNMLFGCRIRTVVPISPAPILILNTMLAPRPIIRRGA